MRISGRGVEVRSWVLFAGVAWAATSASSAAAAGFDFGLREPSPCYAQTCRASVSYSPPAGQSVRLEVDWNHSGPPDIGFTSGATLRCAAAGTADAIYTGAPQVCFGRGPVYTAAQIATVAVRMTASDGTQSYSAGSFSVVLKPGRKPKKPRKQRDPDCGPIVAGESCGPGNGRKTAGGAGTGNVSHVGWPAITGILWKVTGGGDHQHVGGKRNDELLGHHGSDKISGGNGNDVIWGDWDPVNNTTHQSDVLKGGRGNDWIYSSHGRNRITGGPGNDYVWAFYGRGTIDCGPGNDTLRVRLSGRYTYRNCERIKNFCSFGSKPGGGCYKPGERPKTRRSAGGAS